MHDKRRYCYREIPTDRSKLSLCHRTVLSLVHFRAAIVALLLCLGPVASHRVFAGEAPTITDAYVLYFQGRVLDSLAAIGRVKQSGEPVVNRAYSLARILQLCGYAKDL